MRDVSDPPTLVAPPSRTKWRRKRLHDGARRFHRDVCSDGRKFKRVVIFGLSVEDLDPEVAQGAMRRLMKQLRDTQPHIRYLWWAEVQRRGAIHFHGQLVDPRFEFAREARAWFGKHWPLARIQPGAEVKPARWFRENGADYVVKDVNKGARKGYQQVYEDFPVGWRTFSTHRLAFTREEHRPHEDRSYVTMVPRVEPGAALRSVCAHVHATDRHVPAIGGCRLVRDDRLRRRRKFVKERRARLRR